MVRLLVNGAAGRMGRRIIALACESDDLTVVGAFEMAGHPDLGKDAGALAGVGEIGVPVEVRRDIEADAAIDFSLAEGALDMIPWCAEQGIALVVGTTGLGEEGDRRIDEAAKAIPCLLAPNMSLGVNVLCKVVEDVARALGDAYDVEIVETHHNRKKDAPSGTALRLGECVAKGLERDLAEVAVHGREGMVGERTQAEIGFHAVRCGDVVGEHTVIFGGLGERVEIRHVATSRDTFVRGALRAARSLAARAPGRYSMDDILGL